MDYNKEQEEQKFISELVKSPDNLPLNDLLASAAFLGYKEAVKLLVKKGADVNKTYNEYGGIHASNILDAASYSGDIDLIEFLLDNGANVIKGFCIDDSRFQHDTDDSILIGNKLIIPADVSVVVGGGNYEAAIFIPECRAEIDECTMKRVLFDNIYGSGIINSLLNKQYDMVKLLLEKGWDPNSCGSNGHSLLSAAMEVQAPEIFELALEKGATVGHKHVDLFLKAENEKFLDILFLHQHQNNSIDLKFWSHPELTDYHKINDFFTTDSETSQVLYNELTASQKVPLFLATIFLTKSSCSNAEVHNKKINLAQEFISNEHKFELTSEVTEKDPDIDLIGCLDSL
ncbi:MAG: ankyrin repeat domain-containing protein [Rickettsia endosymbiont of Pentastiridius leporinus]